MRMAIYARVSTKDKGQDQANQLLQLRQWREAKGHSIVKEYIDYESGGHSQRPQFKKLSEDARSIASILF